jgi:hypothetical protein
VDAEVGASDAAMLDTVSIQKRGPSKGLHQRLAPAGRKPLEGHDRTLQGCLISEHYRPVPSSSWIEQRRFTISFDNLTNGQLWLKE